jgi:hypothetical protein
VGGWNESLDELKALFTERTALKGRLSVVDQEIASRLERLKGVVVEPIPTAVHVGGSGGSAIIRPLKTRVFEYFEENGDGKTLDEIAAVVGERVLRRVDLCLRDARAKHGLLEKPKDGRWTRTAKGCQYSRKLMSRRNLWDHLLEDDDVK